MFCARKEWIGHRDIEDTEDGGHRAEGERLSRSFSVSLWTLWPSSAVYKS